MRFRVSLLTAVVALCALAPAASAHTLSLRTARVKAERALYYKTPATSSRVRLSDCFRYTRHKVVCVGTYRKSKQVWDECDYISYYGNCYGGYDTETVYCNGTVNVRLRGSRISTWVHSKQCF